MEKIETGDGGVAFRDDAEFLHDLVHLMPYLRNLICHCFLLRVL